MKPGNNRYIKYPTAFSAVLLTTTAFAQLELAPIEIDVNDVMQSRQVRITNDGKPVLRGEILSIVSGVTKTGKAVPASAQGGTHFSNYSHMFDFETGDDGVITIKPKKGLVEIGTYDLRIRTIYGSVVGVINANLRDSIPPKAYHPVNLAEFSHDIRLPDYVYGQGVSVQLSPDSKNIYYWYIDGQLHSSGKGETSFRAWPEAGSHEISYIARDPDGRILSEWSDTISIVEEDVISTTVRKKYQVPFSAPPGYSKVTWRLDDKIISEKKLDRTEQDTQFIKFKSKGNHILTCVASGSETGDFRRITWSIKVK